jgi:hypothetical protein
MQLPEERFSAALWCEKPWAVVFHAGADFLILFAIFSGM